MDENGSNTTSELKGGSSKKWIIIAVAVIVIVVVAAVGGFFFLNSNEGSPAEEIMEGNEEGQIQISPDTKSESGAMMQEDYKDGTYTAVGTYAYHAGTESIGVTITLKDGVVDEISVEEMAKAPMSKQMQADFAANYKTEVVGKNIDEVKLGKVSGSSLTPIGFNQAVDNIKTQASS